MTDVIGMFDRQRARRTKGGVVAALRSATYEIVDAADRAFYYVARMVVGWLPPPAILRLTAPCGNTTDGDGRVTGVWCAAHVGKNEFDVDYLYRNGSGIENTHFRVKGNFGRHRKAATAMALLMAEKLPPEHQYAQYGFGISWIGCEKSWDPVIRCPDIDALVEIIEREHVFHCGQFSKSDLHERIYAHQAHAMQSFTAVLDAEAVSFVAKFTDDKTVEDGGWISWIEENKSRIVDRPGIWAGLDAMFTKGAPLRRMIMSCPQNAEALAAAWMISREGFGDDVVETIRKGLSTVARREVPRAVAAGLYDFHDAMQRTVDEMHLAGARPEKSRPMDGPYLLTTVVACVLSTLPQAWIPRSEAEWVSLARIADPLLYALRRLATDIEPMAFVNAKGRWEETTERLARRLKVEPSKAPLRLTGAVEGVMDMVEAFARQVTAPALAKARRLRTDAHFKDWKHQKIRMNGDLTHIGQKLAKDLLLGGRSLGAILELSVEWHGKQAGIDAAIEAISPGMLDLRRWEAGLPDWDVDGIRIKVLTTLRELHDEGRRGKNTDGSEGLWHCVAGYASKCTGSRTRIVSLRKCVADGTEVRLSTAEINLDSEDYKAVVVQHRGLKNAAPPESTVAALAKYMAAISAGRLQVDRVAIEPPRKDSALDGTITEAAGYEWDILGNVEKAISVWSGFLPRGMRAMTAEDLAALAPSWQN